MKSKASAPGKVILFGEHFVVYGTEAILCSIDKRVKVTSETTDEKNIVIKSALGNISFPTSQPLEEIKSPLIPFAFIAKQMIDKNNHEGGILVEINSEIPPGVGLGSSSACCVAAAASISGLFKKLSKEEIVKLAIEAEKMIFPNTSGADCTVCTFGGIMKYDKQSGFTDLNIPNDFHLVISDSKKIHSTKETVNNVKNFKEQNEERFSILCNEESKLISNIGEAFSSDNLEPVGKAMSLNQKFLEEISVSNDQLQKMIRIADQTSYGSKITGAGNGGCVISLVDKSNLEKTLSNMKKENFECFSVTINPNGLDTF